MRGILLMPYPFTCSLWVRHITSEVTQCFDFPKSLLQCSLLPGMISLTALHSSPYGTDGKSDHSPAVQSGPSLWNHLESMGTLALVKKKSLTELKGETRSLIWKESIETSSIKLLHRGNGGVGCWGVNVGREKLLEGKGRMCGNFWFRTSGSSCLFLQWSRWGWTHGCLHRWWILWGELRWNLRHCQSCAMPQVSLLVLQYAHWMHFVISGALRNQGQGWCGAERKIMIV